MRSERLLICLKTYLGDAVMAMPMVEAIEKEYENTTIQTSPSIQELLQDPIRSRRFIPFQKSRSPWVTVRSAIALRRERYDTVVLVNRSFRAALIATLAGIPHRVGHAQEGRGWLLNVVVPYEENKFEAETCMDLAKALGCEGVARPRIPIPGQLMREARKLLGGATIGVQAGARWTGKRIPLTVLGETVSSLRQDGRQVVLIGGPEEAETTEKLQKMLPTRVASLVGRSDIKRTLGILSNLQLVLGGDTGLMHMAAAVGAPTLTVFGPTNDKKWGHRYAPHRVLVAPNSDMSKVRAIEIITTARRMLGS